LNIIDLDDRVNEDSMEEENLQTSSDTRNVKKDILDNIDLDIVLNDSASRNMQRSFFL
jgi:hypothetical protein